jgi:NAD(P)H-flavin reductase
LVFIAGGIGLIPHRSFINAVLKRRSDFGELTLIYGAKEFNQRLFTDELDYWSLRGDMHVMQTFDVPHPDWTGNIGVVTRFIPGIRTDFKNAEFFICGPPIMYKFVIVSLIERGVSSDHIYLNIERRMRCGVGKCGHCQMNNIYVCRQGPVLKWSQISSLPESIT